MTLMFLMHSALYAVNLVLMSPQNVRQNEIDKVSSVSWLVSQSLNWTISNVKAFD